MTPPPDEQRQRFPKLEDTFRRYVTGTLRVRVQGAGLERYEGPGGHPGRLALVVLAAVALGVLGWLVLGR